MLAANRNFSPLRNYGAIVVFGLLLWLIPAPAGATVMHYADVARLVETSDKIVHAVIGEQEVRLKDGKPWTYTTVEVRRTFQGESKEALTIHQWGGSSGELTGSIPGDARLEEGREVVLFLRRNPEHSGYALTALSQAVFEVYDEGSLRLVRRDLQDLAFVVRQDDGVHLADHREPAHEWSAFVDVLEALVETAVE